MLNTAHSGGTGTYRRLPKLLERASFARAREQVADDEADLDAHPPTLDEMLTKEGKRRVLDAVHKGVQQAEAEVEARSGAAGSQPEAEPAQADAQSRTRAQHTPGPRRNPMGVQLLSPSLHRQLFPGPSLPRSPKRLEKIALEHLAAHELSTTKSSVLPEIAFDMPPLQGANIREHFARVGAHVAEPYLGMASEFAAAELPPMPVRWEAGRAGWTRYDADGTFTPVEDLCDERLVCFDVETLYRISPYPVMATAATPTAWYSWISPAVFADDGGDADADTAARPSLPADLIPIAPRGHATPRLVVGHNVGYDRSMVRDEYHMDRSANRWLDTLSLHVATKGITSVQRPAWQKRRKEKALAQQQENEASQYLAELEGEDAGASDSVVTAAAAVLHGVESALGGDDGDVRWEDVTSANSLAEVARLHCGIQVDKSIRDQFGDASVTSATQLRPDLQHLLRYCANDVKVTHDVLGMVLPLFLASCPHPASFAGALGMGNPFLPIDRAWKTYIDAAERTFRELEGGVKAVLWELAYKLKRRGPVEGDPWTSQLDWSPKTARWLDDEVETGERVAAAATSQQTVATDGPESATAATEAEGVASTEAAEDTTATDVAPALTPARPIWRQRIESMGSFNNVKLGSPVPQLLQVKCHGFPVVESREHRWVFRVSRAEADAKVLAEHGGPLLFDKHDADLASDNDCVWYSVARAGKPKVQNMFAKGRKKDWTDGRLTSAHPEIVAQIMDSAPWSEQVRALESIIIQTQLAGPTSPAGTYLDWAEGTPPKRLSKSKSPAKEVDPASAYTWPKWFWDLTAPLTRSAKGELDLSVRKKIAPLLLRMQWKGYPVVLSREHGWLFRVPVEEESAAGSPVVFLRYPTKDDAALHADTQHAYYKLPHKDGEASNVGSPLAKSFLRYIENGTLKSAPPAEGKEDDGTAVAAADAMDMNTQCSYWVSSRERIMGQMAVYQDKSVDMGMHDGSPDSAGMILPRVISMGTVTRRAVENTWLTASNAKKNRVGSELKAMIRAPPGYSIVGADVDSEELWIASVMGDAQFGNHGATAIGWMTLEGTKSAGTDLHSKTAKILGTSRDAAKVFNYSRIYGAGVKHAVQLLRQNDANLTPEQAKKLAQDLYKATKGHKVVTRRRSAAGGPPQTHLWHGGSESYLFNTLEAIAGHRIPRTPALGCGVTDALKSKYLPNDGVFGSDYLPSRINWVVQSSGVDYLHLLIVTMEYLIERYGIRARYMLSVHDEVRYMVKEEDRYRAALALQIANAWTRALFCYNIGMDDLPQGVAFFSAVDIDRVFRKEVDMACVTPSQPTPIPAGESVDILQLLEKTSNGQLGRDSHGPLGEPVGQTPLPDRYDLNARTHVQFLEAQASASSELARAWLVDEVSRQARRSA